MASERLMSFMGPLMDSGSVSSKRSDGCAKTVAISLEIDFE